MSNDPSQSPPQSTEARSAPRFSIFLAAVLYQPTPIPVRIRNMSVSGALIEGSQLPAAGSIVRLSRGSLSAKGCIAWAGEGRCGIQFDDGVNVRQWLAPSAHREQQRVDTLVQRIKQKETGDDEPDLSIASDRPYWLSDDLARIGHLLERLGDRLADDPDVVQRHETHIQQLDIAVQSLRAIAVLLTAANVASPREDERVFHLRSSATQALEATARSISS